MRIEPYQKREIDTTELFMKYKEKYDHVYFYQIDDMPYFYRPLTRSEYREITTNDNLSDYDKEDAIATTCLLYPENLDIDNCPAGLVTRIANLIIECSYVTKESMHDVLNYYREDMNDINNQITCIIHEAFSNLTMDEIENWDMEKTMRYLSRSEWILHIIRGVPLNTEKGKEALIKWDTPELYPREDPLDYNLPKENVSEKQEPEDKQQDKQSVPNHRGGVKTALTPEKLAELKAKYPDIHWEEDNGQEGLEGLAQPNVYDVATPLRPRNTLPQHPPVV